MMFSAIRRHVTPATTMAFVALVFAVTGGAFAATGGGNSAHAPLTASAARSKAKSKAKAGPRGPAGPRGATGASGPAGPAGPVGATGPAGASGPQGETGPEGKQGIQGVEGEKGANGAPGEEGSPWTAGGTLPPEKTETGTWSFGQAKTEGTEEYAEYGAFVPVSFAIRLKEGLEGSAVHFLTEKTLNCAEPQEPARKECEEENKEVKEREKANQEACPGSAAEPTAEPGNLCVYEALLSGPANNAIRGHVYNGGSSLFPFNVGAGTTGAVLGLRVETEGNVGGTGGAIGIVSGYGTWAVTAPKV
jgi:Collagen triple helix repeat (20 copies)